MKDLLFWLKTSDKFGNTSSEIISISNEMRSISKVIYQYMTNSCIFENLIGNKALASIFATTCRKYFRCLKLYSKLIG